LDKTELAAYACAVRALGRREHCAAELRAKLRQRDYADDVIATVIARLQVDGYQSEPRFAEAFLRMRMRAGEAPWLAAKKASQRGVDAEALQDALQMALENFDALAVCRQMIKRRDPQGLRHDDARIWQRQARFLRNKGFDAATILRALKENNDGPVAED